MIGSPYFYRPHPKDGEGNVFSLSTLGGGGSGQSPARGIRVQRGGSGQSPGGGGQVSPAGGGVSPAGGGSVQPAGGVSQWGGSASCALLRAVCLLRSRRRTFLFSFSFTWISACVERSCPIEMVYCRHTFLCMTFACLQQLNFNMRSRSSP